MKIRTKLLVTVGGTLGAIAALTACDPSDTAKPAFTPEAVAIHSTTAPLETTMTPDAKYQVFTDEDKFLALLDDAGVYYASPEAAVKMAKSICDTRSRYPEEAAVAILFAANQDSGGDTLYTTDELTSLYAASIVIYCPQYS
ncbi:hypothetical protein BI084_gp39 [Gordonia phage Terapin]|uniref:DUF732 domain-containing protein n=5 Tax=Terapinvirus terapin TaxID=2734283 RepID=A0A345MB78_9CAUD|nr:hypothetical protein BI084_gp39 [Gordonia phage Terapin]AVP43315.1 hypothetical protein PBI_DJOKOVIC_38 [Gordonia phage Djokovic]AXH67749.1 hypothetical protein SEA_BEYONCAGE_38 [Gordonia phage Beyoncage]QOC56183.1 hypothetical protein SEA_SIENNA_38 [Gordonia phage Sienna]QOC56608.1 hypothetical protein SEA_BITESIZE_38 [Gordonia phage BiteSize]QYW00841.1 hypothetical protein SEA_MADI_38 [Gordonia phage Madi]